MDPDQTAPIGAVCSGSTLFVSILNSSVMLCKYLQQTTSADDIFRCIFFLGALRVKVPEGVVLLRREISPKSFLKSAKFSICDFCNNFRDYKWDIHINY